MTVAKWTIRQRKWSTFWWAVGISSLIILTLIFYPTIRNQTSQLDKSFNQIPASAKALFTDTQDIFSPVGYLSSQLFYLMLPLILSILAIGMGAGLLSKEESDGTMELLLSRPISRGRLLANKALAGLVVLAIVGGVTTGVIVAMCKLINMDVGLGYVAIASLYSTTLALLFGSIALFIASLGRAGRLASIGVSALVGFGGYIIASLSSVVSWLEWPAKFFPFHYYHPGDILNGRYTWWPLLCFAGISIIFGFLAWLAFRRRDLTGF